MGGMMAKPLAIVFGGSRGIGAACVSALMQGGFDVASTYVSSSPGKAGNGTRAYRANIEAPEDVKAVFDKAQGDFGRPVSCVVVNAGINVPAGPLAQFDPGQFRKLVEVNIVGAFNVLAEAARRVADEGSIIAISTSLVRHAVPGTGAYRHQGGGGVHGALDGEGALAAQGARQCGGPRTGGHRALPCRQDGRGEGAHGGLQSLQPHRQA